MPRRKKGLKIDAWVNLDKPYDMTSTQAVNLVRRQLNAQKAGHAGTLDPLATGILPIALGEPTKTVPYIQDSDKTYEFTVQWGEERTTDDLEGEIVHSSDLAPKKEQIQALLTKFTGEISQFPPKFSAIKINGERAYDLARDGQDVEMKSRTVYIEKLELLEHHESTRTSTFICECGKGTYIRAIGRDLGRDLGCFGFISALKRTKVGPFELNTAISLDILEKMGDNTPTDGVLLPVEMALDDIPALSVTLQEASKLKSGQACSFISRPDIQRLTDIGVEINPKDPSPVLVILQGKPQAIASLSGVELKPVRVFNL